MSELERALSGLQVEFPPPPDIAPRVRARIEAPRAAAPRMRRLRPGLVLAFVLLLCAGAVAASPLREDILDWLGIGGVEVRRVPELPPAPSSDLDLGRRVPPERAGLRLAPLGSPDAAYLRRDPPGGQAAALYRPRAELPESRQSGVGLLLTRFRASATTDFAEKALGPGTRLTRTEVGGAPAAFISGRPHAFVYVDRDGQVREERLRLAGNTLLWERGGFTYRLEAELPLEEAVRLAEGLRERPRP